MDRIKGELEQVQKEKMQLEEDKRRLKISLKKLDEKARSSQEQVSWSRGGESRLVHYTLNS